jgi:hypothetical protein
MTRLLKNLLLCCCLLPLVATAFTATMAPVAFSTIKTSPTSRVSTALPVAAPDLGIVSLVAGQYNDAFAVVCLGEAFWSFFKAPSVDHGIKTIGPAAVAALVLVLVSGPMMTSGGDVSSVGTGLWVATGVSTALGGAYLARLFAPFSPSPKEIAFLGLMVAIAGFFSFSQILIVDGFVTLPSITLPSLPSLPSIQLPF